MPEALFAKPEIETMCGQAFAHWIRGNQLLELSDDFAGRAELLDRFDATKPDSIPHAGTFNNNIATMSAGCVVLSELFTADTAVSLTARGDELRAHAAMQLAKFEVPSRWWLRVEPLPTNATGKVVKSEVLARWPVTA